MTVINLLMGLGLAVVVYGAFSLGRWVGPKKKKQQ